MIAYYLISTILTIIAFGIIILFFDNKKRVNFYFLLLLAIMCLSNYGYLSIAISSNTRILMRQRDRNDLMELFMILVTNGDLIELAAISNLCDEAVWQVQQYFSDAWTNWLFTFIQEAVWQGLILGSRSAISNWIYLYW